MKQDLPKFDDFIHEGIREGVNDVIAEVRKSIEVESKGRVSSMETATAAMMVLAIVIGSGAVTLFGCDVYAHFYPGKYQHVSQMPWSMAGLVSSCTAMILLVGIGLFGE